MRPPQDKAKARHQIEQEAARTAPAPRGGAPARAIPLPGPPALSAAGHAAEQHHGPIVDNFIVLRHRAADRVADARHLGQALVSHRD